MCDADSIDLQKNLGDVLRAADDEAVLVVNRGQPRAVVMCAEEFIRLKTAAGEPIPSEVRKSRPTLHRRPFDRSVMIPATLVCCPNGRGCFKWTAFRRD
ncbi:type II toxin-antitoxin system prevent-host-death family antitoxin [Rhizobium leguminosarum]|uniref:type II toxin-antitoxin system prevent-host-death family antitoxin n=1 Tax=Rhizobium leguminosarum TaxID=384 RepID=UPI001441168B|nr:type II toxin-antitoxin system prevent-host-death family antitoxin [Rhizobium leguminosarum]NKM07738.1 type II toxin-antitoxin system prevent-host-death family antitoxin [Rhizobium leguminosarum bv. viciae]